LPPTAFIVSPHWPLDDERTERELHWQLGIDPHAQPITRNFAACASHGDNYEFIQLSLSSFHERLFRSKEKPLSRARLPGIRSHHLRKFAERLKAIPIATAIIVMVMSAQTGADTSQ
jgi:hypothetical protein